MELLHFHILMVKDLSITVSNFFKNLPLIFTQKALTALIVNIVYENKELKI